VSDEGGPSPASIRVQRRIEWPDTDASGHWHNTAAFRLVEVAETALLERIGLLRQIYGRLPRVHIRADFKELLRFRDLLDCHIRVARIGRTSITYDFQIWREDELCVEAEVVAVLLTPDGDKAEWTKDQRDLLLTAGPQAAELLSVS
jgi:YbgC/YbaW family acyl-CoA thioester hydrolase